MSPDKSTGLKSTILSIVRFVYSLFIFDCFQIGVQSGAYVYGHILDKSTRNMVNVEPKWAWIWSIDCLCKTYDPKKYSQPIEIRSKLKNRRQHLVWFKHSLHKYVYITVADHCGQQYMRNHKPLLQQRCYEYVWISIEYPNERW